MEDRILSSTPAPLIPYYIYFPSVFDFFCLLLELRKGGGRINVTGPSCSVKNTHACCWLKMLPCIVVRNILYLQMSGWQKGLRMQLLQFTLECKNTKFMENSQEEEFSKDAKNKYFVYFPHHYLSYQSHQ